MQIKYIVLLLLCLVVGLSVTSCPVLASSSSKSEDFTKNDTIDDTDLSHGGGGGQHETGPSHGGGGGQHETGPSHGGGGGQHGTVSDDKIVNNIVGSFKVIWNWCCTTKVFIGSYSFTFAQAFLFEILAGIVIWFIGYLLYYG